MLSLGIFSNIDADCVEIIASDPVGTSANAFETFLSLSFSNSIIDVSTERDGK